jgi:hypothetical protein
VSTYWTAVAATTGVATVLAIVAVLAGAGWWVRERRLVARLGWRWARWRTVRRHHRATTRGTP